MSTLEREMLRYMQGKFAYAIARGEEPPWMLFMLHKTCIIICKEKLQMPLQEERNLLMVLFMLRVVFMLHQQTRVLLIHQLKELLGKINLRRHITRMAEVCHFLRCCSLFCNAVIFELDPIVIVL
jgi:hypothetical protein